MTPDDRLTPEALLPCPFCGDVGEVYSDPDHPSWGFRPRCPSVGCLGFVQSLWFETAEIAGMHWNTRSDTLAARLCEVEAERDYLIGEVGRLGEKAIGPDGKVVSIRVSYDKLHEMATENKDMRAEIAALQADRDALRIVLDVARLWSGQVALRQDVPKGIRLAAYDMVKRINLVLPALAAATEKD